MTQKTITQLINAVITGKYSSGTTAWELASIKDTSSKYGETVLHHAARLGSYPPGTTNADLLIVRDSNGRTPLHWAAITGNFLHDTKVADLAHTRDHDGFTALHIAAATGNLPKNTTIRDLANTFDNYGNSALFAAAYTGNLPVGTTAQDMRNTDNRRSLDVLTQKQVTMVLTNTNATDEDEVRWFLKVIGEKYPVETQAWAKREANRLAGISPTPPLNQRQGASAWL